jgi:hypothetical protein
MAWHWKAGVIILLDPTFDPACEAYDFATTGIYNAGVMVGK